MVYRKPTARSLILDAIRNGAVTTDRIAELVGLDAHRVQSDLCDMAARKRVRRVGAVKEDRRGPPRTVWSEA